MAPGRFLLMFVFVSVQLLSRAQNARVDSLNRILLKNPSDTQRVNTLNQLAYELRFLDNERARSSAQEALSLSQKINYETGKANAYLWLGTVYIVASDFQKGMENLLRAIEQGLSSRAEARAHNNLGLAYMYIGRFPDAIAEHYASLRIKEKLNDRKGIADTYNNLGSIYVEQKNYNEALKCFSDCIAIRREMEDEYGLSEVLNSYGIVQSYMGQHLAALETHRKALTIQERNDDEKGASASYSDMGFVYDDLKEYDKALECYLKALGLREKVNFRSGIAISYENLASIYIRKKKFDAAEKYAMMSLKLSRELNYLVMIKAAAEALSVIYESTGRKKDALAYYKMYINVRDSLVNEENTKKIVRQQMQYEFDKKEAAATLEQEKKDAVSAAEVKRQKIMLLSITGFGILVLAFAIFAYRSFLQKKKANHEIVRQKEVIEEKQKEILASIYYARRIQRSLLPSEKYIARKISGLKNG